MIDIAVQEFISKVIKSEDITRKEFAQKVGISYSSVNELLNRTQQNPSLVSALKIANAFQCSVNEVVGLPRTTTITNFKMLQPEEAFSNLRKFIQHQIIAAQQKPRMLAKQVGLSINSIAEFVNEPPSKNSLGTLIISKLAQHWEVSVDEMIGRVEIKKEKTLEPTKDKPKSFVEKLKQQRQNRSTNITR